MDSRTMAPHASDETLRVILEASPVPIISLDLNGTVSLWNRAAERVFGWTAREVLGGPLPIVPAGRTEEAHALRARVARGETLEGVELRRQRKDGSFIELSLSSAPIRDAHGRVSGIINVWMDITERRRAEQVLRDSEERYRLLFESNPHPMWVFDLDTLRFLAVNAAAVEHYGYSRDEFLAMTITDIRPLEDMWQLREDLQGGTAGHQAYRLRRHLKKNGHIIFAEIVAQTIGFGGHRARLVLANDITERIQAEDALRKSEERYRALFEESHDAILLTSMEGAILDVNPAGLELFGYRREELLAMNARVLYVDPSLRDLRRTELEERGWVQEDDVRLRRKDGGELRGLVTRSIRRAPGGAEVGCQELIHDLTEAKSLEGQLRQAQKMEAVGRLAGGVAHDFNNLLMAILGYSELLEDQHDGDVALIENVRQIRKAAESAAALTRQLLAFSRRQLLQPAILDLNSVVAELKDMLRRVIGEDIELVIDLDPLLGHVRADVGQLQQVIMNLAVNARDAMPAGGHLTIETLNAEVDEAFARRRVPMGAGSYVLLAVRDTGVGMTPEVQTHIFEPFFTTKGSEGTGLGLATVYGIVKQSGGYIWVTSASGEGTCFQLYLPRVDAPVVRPVPAVSAETPRGSETILVVEDEPAVREVIATMLRRQGYVVLEAAEPEAALHASSQHGARIDLLLTDLIMPHMNGMDLARRLQVIRNDLKVMYMSGYADRAILEGGAFDSGTAFLQKPFAPAHLARKVRELLEGTPQTE